MTKIAYNNQFGGFGLSEEAKKMYLEKGGDPEAIKSWSMGEWRADPILIDVIETLGKKASGDYCTIAIRDLPEGTAYRIDEYDGNERVMTPDDYEWSIA